MVSGINRLAPVLANYCCLDKAKNLEKKVSFSLHEIRLEIDGKHLMFINWYFSHFLFKSLLRRVNTLALGAS